MLMLLDPCRATREGLGEGCPVASRTEAERTIGIQLTMTISKTEEQRTDLILTAVSCGYIGAARWISKSSGGMEPGPTGCHEVRILTFRRRKNVTACLMDTAHAEFPDFCAANYVRN